MTLNRNGSSTLAAWLPDHGRRDRVLAGGHRNSRSPGSRTAGDGYQGRMKPSFRAGHDAAETSGARPARRDGPLKLALRRSAEVPRDHPAHGGQGGHRTRMAVDGETASEEAVAVPVHRRDDPRVGEDIGLHRIDEIRLKGGSA